MENEEIWQITTRLGEMGYKITSIRIEGEMLMVGLSIPLLTRKSLLDSQRSSKKMSE
jgi:hypothetical protein